MKMFPALLLLTLLAPACSDGSSPATDSGPGGDAVSADSTVPPLGDTDLVNACVRATACGIKPYPKVSNCIDAYYNLHMEQGIHAIYNALYACVNAAKGDCGSIRQCFGQGKACDTTFTAYCDGTKAVSCDTADGRAYSLDCSLAGMKCSKKNKTDTFTAYCTPDSCFSSLGASCSGKLLLTCTDGIQEVTNCGAKGLICDSSKSAACKGETKETCNPKFFVPSCNGSVARSCVNEKEHLTDCSKLTLRTTSCKSPDGVCAMAGTQCKDEVNRCAGDQLEVCLDGTWKKVDCKGLGLAACKLKTTYSTCADPQNP